MPVRHRVRRLSVLRFAALSLALGCAAESTHTGSDARTVPAVCGSSRPADGNMLPVGDGAANVVGIAMGTGSTAAHDASGDTLCVRGGNTL